MPRRQVTALGYSSTFHPTGIAAVTQLLANWTQDTFDSIEEGLVIARHNLAATGLFTDEALIRVLDTHRPEDLSVNTMGVDPKHFDWREGDRNGVPGEVLLNLVREGQLWINCRKMIANHPAFAKVIYALYDEIKQRKPGFKPEEHTANLLISSPTVWVPYHVDMPVNMLWHVRGVKRLWVYPQFDPRFAPPEVLEKVCTGQWSEDVPYDPSFDRYAVVVEAQPGELITWPQLTPHRVRNVEGLNVSLSTEHKNARAKRRINVHTANHFLRTRVGFGHGSFSVDGPSAHAKQALARGLRLAGKFVGNEKKQFVYSKTFVVDPTAPHGFRIVQENIVAPHQELVAEAV
jgi:hypothetical protein